MTCDDLLPIQDQTLTAQAQQWFKAAETAPKCRDLIGHWKWANQHKPIRARHASRGRQPPPRTKDNSVSACTSQQQHVCSRYRYLTLTLRVAKFRKSNQ